MLELEFGNDELIFRISRLFNSISCRIWIERSGRPDLLDKVNVHEERVCERHFESNMFLNDYRNRLHASAVPSIRPINDFHLVPDYSKAIDLSLALVNVCIFSKH